VKTSFYATPYRREVTYKFLITIILNIPLTHEEFNEDEEISCSKIIANDDLGFSKY